MKNYFFWCVLAGTLLVGVPVCATTFPADSIIVPPDRFSMSAFMGAYRFDDFPYNPCILFGTRLGWRLQDRVELEGEFLMGSVENQEMEDGFLANVNLRLLLFPLGGQSIRPYGFGGVGYYEFTGFEGVIPDTKFGWLTGVGSSFTFGGKTRGFVELRLAYFPGLDWGQPGQFGAVWGVRRSF